MHSEPASPEDPSSEMPLPAQAPGVGTILRFALPLMLGLMTHAVNTFVDTLFIGRLGTAPLAAVPMGAFVYLIGWAAGLGLMRNAIAFCSRAYGAGRHRDVGPILAHYHLLALAAAPLLLLFIQVWPLLSAVANLNPEVDALAWSYLRIRACDGLFSLTLVLYSAFYQAIGNSRLPMAFNFCVLGLNVLLDYGLIFGNFGLPALGVEGSAVATVLAQATGAALIVGTAHLGPARRRFALRFTVPVNRPLLRNILSVGIPSGLGDCVEVLAWSGFMLIVGRLGEASLAASNIGIQVTHLLFMPGFALGIAGASYVGRYLGARRPGHARQTALRVLALGIGYMGLSGIPLWFHGEAIAGLFTRDPTVIQSAALMFKVMALYQAVDAMGFITRTILGGAGDTRTPLLVLGCCAVGILFPAAYLGTMWITPPLLGAWMGACVFLVVYAAAMQWRFHGGAWQRIRLATA